MELKKRCKWGRRCCWRGSVWISQWRWDLNWEGKDTAGWEGKHIVLGFVLFVGRYHICEGTGPGMYAMTNGRIDTRRQPLGGVVGMLCGNKWSLL